MSDSADDRDWPLVSVLFITYDRLSLLKPTVESFVRGVDYPRLEIVVADDGSPPQVQAEIRKLPADKFSLPPKNRGLGANNNAGLKLCTGDYVLMVQDDWVFQGPPQVLKEAVRVLRANPEVGRINFGGAAHPPDPSQRLAGSTEPCFVTPRPYEDEIKDYFLYSDQPHLVSRAALEFMGPYREFRDMERCETEYQERWGRQTRFKTAVFPAWHLKAFSNQGGEENSWRLTKFRYRLQERLNPLIRLLKTRFRPGYVGGKAAWLWVMKQLERTGIVR